MKSPYDYIHDSTYKGLDISLMFDPMHPPEVTFRVHSGEKAVMTSGIFTSKDIALKSARKIIDGFLPLIERRDSG